MVDLRDVYAYQATPEAAGLTFEQCAEKVAEQQAALDRITAAPVPAYDPVVHLGALKAERKAWGAGWRKWKGTAHEAVRVERMKELDQKINEVSKLVNA